MRNIRCESRCREVYSSLAGINVGTRHTEHVEGLSGHESCCTGVVDEYPQYVEQRPFRVVQPWGPNKGRQATLISEHSTATEAFAEIDRLAARMVRTGAPSDAIELAVIDAGGTVVERPDTH
jgi:hypothetical protein